MILDLMKSTSSWIVLGLLLGMLELLVPGYLLLGFGLGSFVVAGMLWGLGPEFFDGLLGVAYLSALWAAASLGCWYALRQLPSVRGSASRTVERDINEDPYKGDRD